METDMQVKANHPLYDGVGYVKFTHCGGKEEEIIKSARMSTQKGFQGWDQDKKLLKYLWDNKHATPFEFCTLSVQIKAPIFVARQVFRSRTFSYNELSGRYSELPESFYMPKLKYQDTKNKQGSDGYLSDEEANPIVLECIEHHKKAFALYRTMLQAGVSREQARIVLPVSIMTEWRMCGNLRNWMHFLSLRLDSHAQQETRELAKGIASILKPLYPNTWEVSGYQSLYDTGTLTPLTINFGKSWLVANLGLQKRLNIF